MWQFVVLSAFLYYTIMTLYHMEKFNNKKLRLADLAGSSNLLKLTWVVSRLFQQPGSSSQVPAARFQQPGSSSQVPAARFQQPGSSSQVQQPGSSSQIQQPDSEARVVYLAKNISKPGYIDLVGEVV